MTKKYFAGVVAIAAAISLTACGASDVVEGQTDGTPTDSPVLSVTNGKSDTVVLQPDSSAPSWLTNVLPAETPGEFSAGDCANGLSYSSIRRQDSTDASNGYFTESSLDGVGDGFLITLSDDFVANDFQLAGFIVSVSPETANVFTVESKVKSFFVPDEHLGQNPDLTKENVKEIGLCVN